MIVSSIVFVFAVVAAERAVRLLSPVALAIVFWYSLAKRYTSYTQAFLGLAMAVAPVGGWLAAGGPSARRSRGCSAWRSACGSAASTFSMPARTSTSIARTACNSIPGALRHRAVAVISRVMHVATVVCMAALAWLLPLGPIYLGGVALVAALLIYEQSLVSAARSVAGEARLRSQRVGRHPVFRDDGAGACMSVERPGPPDKSPAKIAGMFDAIAGRYDLLNTVLSGGLDRYWRRRAIASLQLTGRERLLDVCTGTADVAIGARAQRRRARRRRRLLRRDAGARPREGADAAASASRIQLVRGDAMNLPVASESVDAATIAFGIRNVQQPEVACRGAVPRAPARRPPRDPRVRHCRARRLFGPIYHWYSRNVLPRIGRAVSRHDAAYTYLPDRSGPLPTATSSRESCVPQGFHKLRPGH